jgi:GTP-binding protein
VKKQAIVPESPRPAHRAPAPREAEGPHPLQGAEFVIGAAGPAQLPQPGPPEIAFAGRSNAGKSSAINALANRTRLAFASRTPGRTQQINFFRLRGGGLIADLPGYGYAAVARSVKRSWQEFLWHYVTTRGTLVALVVVVDARHGLKALDEELLNAFLPSGRPVLILATKADKLSRTEERNAVAGIEARLSQAFSANAPQARVVSFSATRRTGVEAAETILAGWIA